MILSTGTMGLPEVGTWATPLAHPALRVHPATSQVYAAGDLDPLPVDPVVAVFEEGGDRATYVLGEAEAA